MELQHLAQTSERGAIILGRRLIAKAPVLVDQLRSGGDPVRVDFELGAPTRVECRAFVFGAIPLLIHAVPRPIKLPDRTEADDAAIAAARFPEPTSHGLPDFFTENAAQLRHLHEQGVLIGIADGSVVLNIDGVRLYARQLDDLRFVEPIYFRNEYNAIAGCELCAIDIGMNIGLTTLFLAKKNNVREIYAFEPFEPTFQRAVANLSLNPELARKVSVKNIGLSDKDEDLTVLLNQEADSGRWSIRGARSGRAAAISVRNAATVLGPIIDRAIIQNRKVLVKVDCEGSEFMIFKALRMSGYLRKISMFMVEWHRSFAHMSVNTLISPLVKNGFVVFDISGRREDGNGFFYAARCR